MRVSSSLSLLAVALVTAAISACTGMVQVTPTCDGGSCTSGGDGGTDGGQGKEGDSCFNNGDCASPNVCMFPVPSEETPATACGSAGVCRPQAGCGIACPAPATYIGCDCAGLSVSSCQCDSAYLSQQLSVRYAAPTTLLHCPNDPPNANDAGPPPGDASGDLNATGSLYVDNQKCSLTSASRMTQSAPDGHTWTLNIGATCPGGLGAVSLYVVGTDTLIYPYGCATAGMQLSVGGEGDGGFLAYDGKNAGSSCMVNDGPTASDEPNKVRGTGTLSNGAGKSHTVDLFEP
jgi:hypothetical protein